MIEHYRTITHPRENEIPKIKGSRFIARAVPLQDGKELETHLGAARQSVPNAHHHVYAYRLGSGKDRFRYSDDGEPSGSAGRPILQQIDGRVITNVLVIVSRIFGGTKLGVGGLMRAYGGAAAAVLELADIVRVTITRRIRLCFDYELSGTIASVLRAAGYEPAETHFDRRVTMWIEVAAAEADKLCERIRERTSARAEAHIVE